MNWARAKTILIILLLAINAFLLMTYIVRDNSVRYDEMTVRTEVCRIVAMQGIELKEEMIPLDSVKIRPAMVTETADMKRAAERMFGAVTEETADGSVAYFGEGGSIMFSNDAFSLVYDSENEVTEKDDAMALAKNVAAKLGVSTAPREFSCQYSDGGYSVRVPQMFSGVPAFDCSIELKISEGGNVIASGKFIGKRSLTQADGRVLSTSSLLLSFADEVRTAGHIPMKVLEVTLGYVSKKPAAGRVILVPTIRFLTDKGTFYVDMQTGKMIEN